MSDADSKPSPVPSAAKEQFANFIEKLNRQCKGLPYIPVIAEKAKTKPAYVVLGGGGFLFFIFVLMVGLNALVEMACFAYPAFMAIKSLKESSGYEVWLTYFMIFSSFHVMEALYGHPDPMTDSTTYILFKLVVLVLCFLPMTNGAERIYKMGIKRVIAAADAKTD